MVALKARAGSPRAQDRQDRGRLPRQYDSSRQAPAHTENWGPRAAAARRSRAARRRACSTRRDLPFNDTQSTLAILEEHAASLRP